MDIKKLQNNFTTPEQSKRLLELGVPADSADMYWRKDKHGDLGYVSIIPSGGKLDEMDVPCWSAGRLIEILELCTSSKFKRIKTECSVLEDILWQIEIHVTKTSKGFCIDFSKLEE